MKEELELKHTAPYLPYGLRIMHGKDIKKMNAAQGSSKYWIGIGAVIRWQGVVSRPTPILHPLSDLTKEIEHDGERFVPIAELMKIAYQSIYDDEYRGKINIVDKRLHSVECWGVDFWQDKEQKLSEHTIRFGIELPNALVFTVDNTELTIPQFEIYKKLHQWHFDTDGLIEKGLAIDVNTLDENPYK